MLNIFILLMIHAEEQHSDSLHRFCQVDKGVSNTSPEGAGTLAVASINSRAKRLAGKAKAKESVLTGNSAPRG